MFHLEAKKKISWMNSCSGKLFEKTFLLSIELSWPLYHRVCHRASPWFSGKKSACNAGSPGDTCSSPGLGRSPGGGNGNPLQYSCLKNPMDRGAWWATVHRVSKSQTQLKQLSTQHFIINGLAGYLCIFMYYTLFY